MKLSVALLFSLLLETWVSPLTKASKEDHGGKDDCQTNCDDFHWSYDESTGPECWDVCFATCRRGRKQSPINIQTASTNHTAFPALTLKGWDQGHDMKLSNNGHTAKVKLEKDAYLVSGMGLDGTYVAEQFHFHWGASTNRGSEHTIDGVSAPLELHIVTHSDSFDDVGGAVGEEGGIAVLGIQFHISRTDNAALDAIASSLPAVSNVGAEVTLEKQVLAEFLPSDTAGFYRYEGSLTTPGCAEGVVWTVFKESLPVSWKQLRAFRSKLLSSDGSILCHNYRPVQPLYGRIVYRSTP